MDAAERARLIEAELPGLRRYARALVGGRGYADDLVHDCVERALSRWVLWRREQALRPWLFSIMHNLFVSARRRDARRGAPVELDEAAPYTARPPEQGAAVLLGELARGLRELPEEQREVVLLVGLEGFSYAEAAGIAGVPVGTVMSRLSRGRARLRERLEGEGGAVLRRVK